MKKLLCTFILLVTTVGFVQAQQEIDVLGNAISIIGDGTNTPNLADGTDFGQVTNGTSSVEQIFTIQNTGTATIECRSSVYNKSDLCNYNIPSRICGCRKFYYNWYYL